MGRRGTCTHIAMLVGLAMAIAAPAVAQAQDPFQSAPGPTPDKPAMPRANPPKAPPAVQGERPLYTPPPAPAVSALPNLDRIREFAAARNIPLPQDLQIRRPGPDIPASMARFSGVWGGDGKWNGRCRQILVTVEAIERSGQATVVHAEGPAESFCYGSNSSSRFRRVYAVIQGDSIIYTTSAGIERKFTLVNDNQLHGVTAANPDLKPPYKGAVISIFRLN